MYEFGAALHLGRMNVAKEWKDKDAQGNNQYLHKLETTFHLFQLFGDPETQLWTEEPLTLDADYPLQIGTFSTQRFVVNVSESGMPVRFAKVCLQKDNDILKVGYTNYLGQVVFNVTASYAGDMNITVTKHNYRPYLGTIECVCGGATVDVTPARGVLGSDVKFRVYGFYPSEDIQILIDNTLVTTIAAGTNSIIDIVPAGGIGLVNVFAIGLESGQIAVTVYGRLADSLTNDVFIYSQWDPTTWYLAGDPPIKTWDNPCITIYNEGGTIVQPDKMGQLESYLVGVTVYNKGPYEASNTVVSLAYARFGGGLTWKDLGSQTKSIQPGQSIEILFSFSPDFQGKFCLRASLVNTGDMNENNNVGQENIVVEQFSSPLNLEFGIGNPAPATPTPTSAYISLNVRQIGNYSDVWSATIVQYSYSAIAAGENETIKLEINPLIELEEVVSRLFVVDIYVDDNLIGGLSINASNPLKQVINPWRWIQENWLPLALGIGIGVSVAIVLLLINKKRGT